MPRIAAPPSGKRSRKYPWPRARRSWGGLPGAIALWLVTITSSKPASLSRAAALNTPGKKRSASGVVGAIAGSSCSVPSRSRKTAGLRAGSLASATALGPLVLLAQAHRDEDARRFVAAVDLDRR